MRRGREVKAELTNVRVWILFNRFHMEMETLMMTKQLSGCMLVSAAATLTLPIPGWLLHLPWSHGILCDRAS